MAQQGSSEEASVQTRSRGLTQKQVAFLTTALAVFGGIAGVAQLVASTGRTLVLTVLIVLALGLILFGAWWLPRGGRTTAVSRRLLGALTLAAMLVGAGGTAAVGWVLDSRTGTPSPAHSTGRSTGTPPSTTFTPSAPASLAPTLAPPMPDVSPPAPQPSEVCRGEFRPTVRIRPTDREFDVVVSYDCRPRDGERPWLFVRLDDVGEHETTNYYRLEDFTGESSPFEFPSTTAERRATKCYVVVVFDGEGPAQKEYVRELPDNARKASACVS